MKSQVLSRAAFFTLIAAASVSASTGTPTKDCKDSALACTESEIAYQKASVASHDKSDARVQKQADKIAQGGVKGVAQRVLGIPQIFTNSVANAIEENKSKDFQKASEMLIDARVFTHATRAKKPAPFNPEIQKIGEEHYKKLHEAGATIGSLLTVDDVVSKAHLLLNQYNQDGQNRLIANPSRPDGLTSLERRIENGLEEFYPVPKKPKESSRRKKDGVDRAPQPVEPAAPQSGGAR